MNRQSHNKIWIGRLIIIFFAAVYGLGLSAVVESLLSLWPAINAGDITATIAFGALAPSALMAGQGLFYVRRRPGAPSVFIELRAINIPLAFLLLPSFKCLYSGPGLEIIPHEKHKYFLNEAEEKLLNHCSTAARLALLLDGRSPLELLLFNLSKCCFLPARALAMLFLLLSAPARQIMRLFGYIFTVVWRRWLSSPDLSQNYIDCQLIVLDLARRVKSLGADEYSVENLKAMRHGLAHCYNDPEYAMASYHGDNSSDPDSGFKNFFSATRLQPRYYGLYLDLPVTLYAHTPQDLYDMQAKAGEEGLYQPDLAKVMQQAALLESEKQRLLSLLQRHGPSGMANLDGRPVFGWDLTNAVLDLEDELKAISIRIAGHHRRCRGQRLAEAGCLGQGWPEHLKNLGALLFFAEHSMHSMVHRIREFKRNSAPETEILPLNDDADVLAQLYAAQRLLKHPDLLKYASIFFREARKLHNNLLILSQYGFISPQEAETCFALLEPSAGQLKLWLRAWPRESLKLLAAFEKLRINTLNALLEAEAEVELLLTKKEHGVISSAPDIFTEDCPLNVHLSAPAKPMERIRAYSPAEHLRTGFGRSALALIIFALLCWQGHYQGNSRISIYNGLGTTVNVAIGSKQCTVEAFGHAYMSLPPGQVYRVETYARGELVESFKQRLLTRPSLEVYNIAGAAPLKESLVSPGQKSDDSKGHYLGRPRWTISNAQSLFKEPSLIRRNKVLTLSGHGDMSPEKMMEIFADDEDRQELMALHARWDEADTIWGEHWREIYKQRNGPIKRKEEQYKKN